MIFFIGFIFSFIFAVIFTPVSMLLAKKFDVLDYPRARKVHRSPLPRWGGIGIYLGFMGGLAAVYYIVPSFDDFLTHSYKGLILERQLVGVLIGSSIAMVVGAIDDKKNIRAITKLLVQIIAALVAMDYGVRIFGLTVPFYRYVEFPQWLGQIVTVFWIAGFMNTVNLADGLDGLASGIVLIASCALFAVSLMLQQIATEEFARQLVLSSVFAAGLAGATLGFLVFNFPPARVFMGDSGALFIGFMLAIVAATGMLKSTIFISLLIPIIVIALPVLDVCLSIFRRWRRGIKLSTPDKEHIHHRFLQYGWSQREVVLLMYVFTLILSNIAILITALNKSLRI